MVEKTFFSDTVKIKVPRDFVFKFLTDFSERERWIEGLESVEVIPAKGEKVGTEIKESIHVHGHKWECKLTILECRKDEYFKLRIEDDKESVILDYTLTGDEEKTLLTETATLIEGTIIHRFITGLEKHTLDKRLHKFKEVVEDEYQKSR